MCAGQSSVLRAIGAAADDMFAFKPVIEHMGYFLQLVVVPMMNLGKVPESSHPDMFRPKYK